MQNTELIGNSPRTRFKREYVNEEKSGRLSQNESKKSCEWYNFDILYEKSRSF